MVAVLTSLGLILGCLVTAVPGAAAASSATLRIPDGGGTPHAGQVTGVRRAAAATAAPAGYSVTGIDVSSHQGDVDWTTVAAAGSSFALVKATEGTTYTNPYYAAQYSGALAAGLDVGSYAFGRPDADNPVAQADYLIAQSDSPTAGRTLPFMLDLESPYSGTGVTDRCWNLSAPNMLTWVRSFVNEVTVKTGMPTLIYTSASWWSACTANSSAVSGALLDIAYWSATPPKTVPASWSAWTIWQYADSGSLPGDQDVFAGTRTQLDALTHTSGPFRDVPATSPFAADISWLVDQGITTGYTDGTFRPTAKVARQEMAAFLYRYANPGVTAPACTTQPFADIAVDSAFCPYIAALKAAGTVQGYGDGRYHPTAGVSRQEMAAFLYRTAEPESAAPACTSAPFPDVPFSSPFCGDIRYLVQAGVTVGETDGDFHPNQVVARQAMAAFLHRLSGATPA